MRSIFPVAGLILILTFQLPAMAADGPGLSAVGTPSSSNPVETPQLSNAGKDRDRSSNPDKEEISQALIDLLGLKSLHIKAIDPNGVDLSPVERACLQGDLDGLKKLIKEGSDIESADGQGIAPIFIAARLGRTDIVKLLLSRGVDANFAVNYGVVAHTGWTPLMFAVAGGNLDTTRAILSAGADTRLVNSSGNSALSMALGRNDHEAARLIREAAARQVVAAQKRSKERRVARAPNPASTRQGQELEAHGFITSVVAGGLVMTMDPLPWDHWSSEGSRIFVESVPSGVRQALDGQCNEAVAGGFGSVSGSSAPLATLHVAPAKGYRTFTTDSGEVLRLRVYRYRYLDSGPDCP